jgi:hypothetical protein
MHVAVAMPEKGGRPSVVAAEVFRGPDVAGRRRWHFQVGYVDRVADMTVQGAREAIVELTAKIAEIHPCVFVDIGTPQGYALKRSFRAGWNEKDLHMPHAYQRLKMETALFAAFLEAYADGRVTFLDDVRFRRDVDKALILYRGGATSKAAEEMPSEDEGLVSALCLALMWPSHGPDPRPLRTEERDLILATTTP